MSRITAAAPLRSTWLMRPVNLTSATRTFQTSMAGLILQSALAPLTALTPNAAGTRKVTRKVPGKAPGKVTRKEAGKQAGKTLGTVLAQMRSARSGLPGAVSRLHRKRRAPAPDVPPGARYLTRRHFSATGSRGYKLYLPASAPKHPAGLIVMLHGCSQTPDDFAIGTHMNVLAEKHGLAIAYPAQTRGHNASRCWNWFKPGDQRRGAGEPALLASLTRKLCREFGLGRDATFVAGLSAGGAMASILSDVYPELFSAAGLHSGLARGSASNVMSAMSAMRSGGTSGGAAPVGAPLSAPMRRIVFHGDADMTVHPSNAPLIVAAALGVEAVPARTGKRSVRGRGYVRSDFAGADGVVVLELWMLEGAGHAWSGGRAPGSFTDRTGPDASAQMIRFFLTKSD